MRNQCTTIEDRDDVYKGEEDCILREGLIVDEPLHRPDWLEEGAKKMCFANATRAAIDYEHLRYVEGYACFMGLPMQHAWVVDMRDGKHYDPTWEDRGDQYHGVVFDTEFILKLMLRTDNYGVWASEDYEIIGDYMRDGFPDNAIVKL